MQTFLPFDSFKKSVAVLDRTRLGKQRLECKQLLNALSRGGGAWFNHPACQQWIGYENALKQYMNECIKEWIKRGYKNTMELNYVSEFTMPPWLGDPAFHASHRSNLLRKDPIHYGQFGWTEPDNLPYVWPSKMEKLA